MWTQVTNILYWDLHLAWPQDQQMANPGQFDTLLQRPLIIFTREATPRVASGSATTHMCTTTANMPLSIRSSED